MKKAFLYFIILDCFLILGACSYKKNITPESAAIPDNNPTKIQSQQVTPENVEITKSPAATSLSVAKNTISPDSTTWSSSPIPSQNNDKAYKDKWDKLAEKFGSTMSNAYSDIYRLDEAISKEPDPVLFLCEGMKQHNIVIRWYCANKIIEYYNKPGVKNAVEPLNNLLKEPAIHDSAALSLAIINRTYDNGHLVKSHKGNKYLFTKYLGSRYNDGKLWIIDEGKIHCITENISIGGFGWSPDDEWLYANPYGRTSSDMIVVNVKSGKAYNIPVFEYICENSSKLGYKVGKNQRSDPWINFIEWSPDSSRILLSYWFNDDEYTGQKGIAVYNIAEQFLEKVTPLGLAKVDYEVVKKPDGFNWN